MKATKRFSTVALAAMLTLGTSFTIHAATSFVKDVKLIGGTQTEVNNLKTTYQNQGWTVIDSDLNENAGGDYIYLLVKRETSDGGNYGYVTGFYIKSGASGVTNTLTAGGKTYYLTPYDGGSHFKSTKGDLNSGTGNSSASIHLYYTKDTSSGKAVSGITFNDTQSGALGENGGSTGYDLNKGCGSNSDYIYMHVTTANASMTVNLGSLTRNCTAVDGMTLTGTLTANVGVSIASNATVTLSNATIDARSGFTGSGITCEGDATIILNGVNKTSGSNPGYVLNGGAGIRVLANSTLTIRGTGSLEAIGKGVAAAIGGGERIVSSFGNIVIEGGTITARGGIQSAAIGGSSEDLGMPGNITITGGTVDARGDPPAGYLKSVGIGTGQYGTCGNITITGGTVNAVDIGSCVTDSGCGNITISGGTVNGGHIGSNSGSCGNITISGGTVTATKNGCIHSIGKYRDSDTCGTVKIGGVTTGCIVQDPITYSSTDTTTYTASFNANGGTGSTSAITSRPNTPRQIPANGFTRTGYTFTKWNTASNGSGTTYDVGQWVILKNTTIYAQWSRNTYTIGYTLNNGSLPSGKTNPASYNVDTATFTLNNPTRNYYNFAGWTGSNGNTAQTTVTINKGSTGNRTYTANWTPVNYNISYNLMNGSLPSGKTNPASYNVESAAITLNEPTRTGYTFTGWTGTGLSTPTKNVTIPRGSTGDRSYTANWVAVTYNISYNLASGSLPSGKTNPASYNIATATFTLNEPTRTGYTFTGWTGTGLSSPTKNVRITQGSTGDRSYAANWSIVTYTISYDLAGGSLPSGASNPATYNVTNATFTLNEPVRTGYTFAGWSGTSLSSPTKNVSIAKGSTGDRSYTANWTPRTVSVIFDPNGGSGAMAPQTFTTAVPQALHTNEFACADYIFLEWNTASNGTGTAYADGQTLTLVATNASETLYAQWTPATYNISYDLAGGSLPSDTSNPATYNVESADITLAAPTRPGYDFAGWTGTGQATPVNPLVIAHGSSGDRTYVANWTPRTVSVIFDPNGGTGAMAPQTFTTDVPQALHTNEFACTDYLFLEWNTAAAGTGESYTNAQSVTLVATNATMTLYAQWVPPTNVLTSGSEEVKLFNGQTLTGTGGTDTRIVVAAGATVTLLDVDLTGTSGSWAGVTCLGDATIILAGSNTVFSGDGYCAGLQAGPAGTTLTISGDGALDVTSECTDDWGYAAAIGSACGEICGDIVIEGGVIAADGSYLGCSIGHGYNGSCGSITIADGLAVTTNDVVVAYADRAAACAGTLVGVAPCEHDGGMFMESRHAYCEFCGAELPWFFGSGGDGTAASPWLISSADDWNELVDTIVAGFTGVGGHFRLAADIAVTNWVGTAENPFRGTFDGAGYTLTTSLTVPVVVTNGVPCVTPFVAPFSIVSNATIRNLLVGGSVSGGDHSAGLVGSASGTNLIENCRVTANVHSRTTKAPCGGLIGHGGSSATTLRGCVFSGWLAAPAECSGSIWGWSDAGATPVLIDCYDNGQTDAPVGRGAYSTLCVSNTYYFVPNKTTDGDHAWTDNVAGMKYACTVSSEESVTIDFGEPAATYSVSGITAYPVGLAYGGKFYAGAGDVVTLSLSAQSACAIPLSFSVKNNYAALAQDGNVWRLAMSNHSVEIIRVYRLLDGDVLTGGFNENIPIYVADGATVTLSNAVVNASPRNDSAHPDASIECLGNATIVLKGTNVVDSSGTRTGPGIQAGPSGTTLVILGDGTLTAIGGNDAAGIGGGYQTTCGHVEIRDTVARVTAIAGSNAPFSVGAGVNGTCAGVTVGGTDRGDIAANPFDYEPSYPTATVTFDANGGTGAMAPQTFMAGYPQNLSTNTFVREGMVFIEWNTASDGSGTSYFSGQFLTIPHDMTLYATWTDRDVNITSQTGDITLLDGQLATGTGGTDTHMVITPGATVTISNLTIRGEHDKARQWAGITCLGDATIVLEGENYVRGFYEDNPGIYIPEGATLVILGTGSLEVESNGYAAGIGGGFSISCGSITIEGGAVTATGGKYAAGIGGGCDGTCDDVTITGGTVTATGGEYAAGIGGGCYGLCGNVTITGGTVTATGGDYAAGIGGGCYVLCDDITITGGTVTATGGREAAGIGCGYGTECGHVDIRNTVVRVTAFAGKDAPFSVGTDVNGTCAGVTVGGTDRGDIAANPFDYEPSRPTATVTFDANGGTGAIAPQTFTAGYPQNLPTNAFVREGMVFVEWNTASDGSGTGYSSGQYLTIPHDMTLYATWADREVNITSQTGDITLFDGQLATGTGGTDTHMVITPGATVTISNLTIAGEDNYDCQWAGITCLGDATIVLEGENYVQGFYEDFPGIYVPEGATLVILGAGWLSAYSNDYAAGIGGGYRLSCGNITIAGGLLATSGGYYSAGIGGGKEASCGNITITGGTVGASGGNVAIGAGESGTGGAIAIADGLMVSLRTSMPQELVPVAYMDRIATCAADAWKLVVIEPCAHEGDVFLKAGSKYCALCGAEIEAFGTGAGTGTAEDPWQIATAASWGKMVDAVADGLVTTGKFFLLTADITVTNRVGTAENPFCGTFDGGGFTLTANLRSSDNFVAPFSVISNATITNLVVGGTVSGHMHCSGLVGYASGTNLVENCLVSAEVSSSDAHCCGVLGHGGTSATTLRGCVFSGILPVLGNNVAVFWGWSDDGAAPSLIDCFDASDSPGPIGRGDYASLVFENVNYQTYFKWLSSGQRDWSEHHCGKQVYSVTEGEGVTIDFGTPVATYRTSGLAVYGTGVSYGNVFYAGAGETIDLSLSGRTEAGFMVEDGTLARNGDVWTLTMPENDVVIELIPPEQYGISLVSDANVRAYEGVLAVNGSPTDRFCAASNDTVMVVYAARPGWTVDSMSVVADNGETVPCIVQAEPDMPWFYVAMFSMPASPVTVTPVVVAANYAALSVGENQVSSGVYAFTVPTNGLYLLDIDESNGWAWELADDFGNFVDVQMDGSATLIGGRTCYIIVSNGDGSNSTTELTISKTGDAVLYPVTVAPAEHGTIEASVSAAPAGYPVSLTATPDPGWVLSEIVLTSSRGDESLEFYGIIEELTHSFHMPFEPVTVTALFERDATLHVGENAVLFDNDTPDLAFTPPISGWYHFRLTERGYSYCDVYDERGYGVAVDYYWDEQGNLNFLVPLQSGKTYKIYIDCDPSNPVLASIVISRPALRSVAVDDDIEHGSVAAFDYDDATPSEAPEGGRIRVEPFPDSGYALGAWNVTDATGGVVSVKWDWDQDYWYFIVPGTNVTVSATFGRPLPITFVDSAQAGFDEMFANDQWISGQAPQAAAGATVKAYYYCNPDWAITSATVTTADGTSVPCVVEPSEDFLYHCLTFTMPDSPVTVVPTAAQVDYPAFTLGDNTVSTNGIWKFVVPTSGVYSISMTSTPGHWWMVAFDSWGGYLGEGRDFEMAFTEGERCYFQVYDSDVNPTVVTIERTNDCELHSVTIASEVADKIVASLSEAPEGRTIALTAAAGYEITRLTVTDANGYELDIERYPNTYYFSMPGTNVTVMAEVRTALAFPAYLANADDDVRENYRTWAAKYGPDTAGTHRDAFLLNIDPATPIPPGAALLKIVEFRFTATSMYIELASDVTQFEENGTGMLGNGFLALRSALSLSSDPDDWETVGPLPVVFRNGHAIFSYDDQEINGENSVPLEGEGAPLEGEIGLEPEDPMPRPSSFFFKAILTDRVNTVVY